MIKELFFQKVMMLLLVLLFPLVTNAHFQGLIPDNTATHKAVQSGDWSNPSTWNTGTIPELSSIVIIPAGLTVNYNVNSNAHIFAIRNDGRLNFLANSNNINRKLVVDTFVNGVDSFLNMKAENSLTGRIEIIIKAFNIESKKSGNIGGSTWNNNAKNHYKDGNTVFDHFGNALNNDGPGVLGRYSWDPEQLTLGLLTMGKVRITGYDVKDFMKTSQNALKNSNSINLASTPEGWRVGDDVMITGTENITHSEVAKITAINGDRIVLNKNLSKDHKGYRNRNWFPYVANLSRTITVKSFEKEKITHRGHSMFMFNPDVIVKNAAFVNLGRTNKMNIIDDFKFNFSYTGNGNQTDIRITGLDYSMAQPKNIENQRGRYGMHFHRTGALLESKLAIAQGCVVWGTPGWGMVHHDSNASFTENVVFDVLGGGMVAESGSETGIWKDNLVAGVLKGPISNSPLRNGMTAPIKRNVREKLDDDFKTGSAYALQGRTVRMVDNVAASSTIAYSYQSSGQITPISDKIDTRTLALDMFPLEDYIDRDLPAIIEFKGNESAACRNSFKSQIRQKGFHRVQSIIEDLEGWNNSQFTVYLSTNMAYTFKNCRFQTREPNRTVAALIIPDLDNVNWSNVVYDGYTDIGINGQGNAFHPKSKFLFHNVTWLNSTSNPFQNLNAQFRRILDDGDLRNGPIRFTPNNNMDTQLNLNAGDFRVVVDGMVNDSAGEYEFGHFLKNNTEANLKRVYNFKNRQKVEKYIDEYGLFSDANGLYTILTEYISDRLSGKIETFEFKIRLNGVGTLDVRSYDILDGSSYIKIMKNPISNGVLHLMQKGNTQLRIINLAGKIIKEIEINPENSNIDINVSGLQSGLYLLSSDNNSTSKFIIK